MFDLIVLGGGPAGYLAAERAGEAGLTTALIEKNKIGGVCLNEGCIPSKTLLNSAKIYEHAKHGQVYGVTAEQVTIDAAAVVKRKNKVVTKLVSGIRATLKARKVTIYSGHGTVVDRKDGVIRVSVNDEILEGRQLLIATGSEAIVPPIPGVREGLDAGRVLTNREILDLEAIPESLVIIGGGVIGLEMAAYYGTCGSQVTVVEMLDHIAGNADREISTVLQKAFEKQGIVFHLNSRVTRVDNESVHFENSEGSHTVKADKVLLSVGRKPVTQDIGLENINVHLERGHIVTDRQGLTNVPNVFAAGDVNGIWMLAHAAYREAEVAVNTMLGRKDIMRYQAMPSVIYTQPEMAFVGETEETCQEKGIHYKKVVLPMNFSGRYMAENEGGTGLIKLIVDQDKDCVIGCHLLGGYASEIILTAGVIIEAEMKISDVKELIFPHPTVSEIIREAIFHI
ncbi:MAG: dihydrolipoyl dehydrogenase [Clostridiaceae bacterium]|nr:dihydrolipoyl dehydrogenase [Clostridiaceae bacterium]